MLFKLALFTAVIASVAAQNVVALGELLNANILGGGSALINANVLANVLGPSQCSGQFAVGVVANFALLNLFSTCSCLQVGNVATAASICKACPKNASPICASATCGCQCDSGYFATEFGTCLPATTACAAPNVLNLLSNGKGKCACARGFVEVSESPNREFRSSLRASMSWLVNAAKRLLSVPTSSGTSPGALLHPGAWIAPGEIPIEEWLPRFRPSLQKSRHLSSDLSMHQVPWFWIITKQAENGAIEIDEETFTEDGERLVKEMIAAAESQKAEMDATRRTEGLARIHANFNNEIGRLCEKTNIRSGKWICQLPLDIVDEKFDIVATALANPDSTFAATSAHTLKISTTLKGDSHEMHIHAASSFDPNDMTAMARWLVDVAGIVPVGYDCDANTLLGIDANHASGIPSPRYRITDFIPSDELRRKFATKLP